MKWQILLGIPSYPLEKQSKIILACTTLHNFIRDSAMSDKEFDRCDEDETYMPMATENSSQVSDGDRRSYWKLVCNLTRCCGILKYLLCEFTYQ
jgi:hypothetical protein